MFNFVSRWKPVNRWWPVNLPLPLTIGFPLIWPWVNLYFWRGVRLEGIGFRFTKGRTKLLKPSRNRTSLTYLVSPHPLSTTSKTAVDVNFGGHPPKPAMPSPKILLQRPRGLQVPSRCRELSWLEVARAEFLGSRDVFWSFGLGKGMSRDGR